MFGEAGRAAAGLRRAVRLAAADRRRGARRPRRRAEPDLPRRRRHLRPRRRGAAVPARHRAAGDRRRGVGRSSSGASPSGCSRWRRSSPTSTAPGRCSPTGSCRATWSPPARTSTAQAHGLVPPNGVRVHVSGIDLVRDEAGDFRVLEDNLRSPSGVSYVITNRAAMSQVLPELFADHRIQPVADYPSKLLAALQGVRAVERGRPDGRRPHARRLQLRLLRARAAGPPDGRRAGRGPRPDLRGQPGEHADDGRPAARRRHLPPHRRRVPRPGALPARLGDRLRRRAERRAGRPGDHRQRRRQRRRRRQAALHLGARPDPLLPGRGAGAGRTPTPTGSTSGTPSSGCWSPSTSWCSSRSTARAARASSSGRGPTSRR